MKLDGLPIEGFDDDPSEWVSGVHRPVIDPEPEDDPGIDWDDDDFWAYLPESRVWDALHNPDNRHLY